jgi:tetratricopeptide (TPR) repeat protein
MRVHLFSRSLTVAVAAAIPVFAQQTPVEEVTRAAVLNDEGRFHETLQRVEPFLEAGAGRADAATIGIAWNIRGLAWQNLDDFDQARRSYEKAISILRGLPDQRVQYASAVDNLGSLDRDLGQMSESKSLETQAKKLFEQENNHAGVARISSNLALSAIVQGRIKDARRYLAVAFKEEDLLPAPNNADLAEMHSVQCLLKGHERDFAGALASIDQAIRLWADHYGPRYYLLAAGYSLRGQVDGRLGNRQNALADLQRALVLLRVTDGSGSRAYFLTELAHAHALRDAGSKTQASQLETEARISLADLRRRQCDGCTVSAAGFR